MLKVSVEKSLVFGPGVSGGGSCRRGRRGFGLGRLCVGPGSLCGKGRVVGGSARSRGREDGVEVGWGGSVSPGVGLSEVGGWGKELSLFDAVDGLSGPSLCGGVGTGVRFVWYTETPVMWEQGVEDKIESHLDETCEYECTAFAGFCNCEYCIFVLHLDFKCFRVHCMAVHN